MLARLLLSQLAFSAVLIVSQLLSALYHQHHRPAQLASWLTYR